MISKRLTTLALTAGCAIVLAAAAQAQPYPQATAPQSTQSYNYQQQSQNSVEPQQQPYQQQAYNATPPEVVTNGPQVNRGDRYGWSPRQNVIDSRHYDNMLETNLSFRHSRERKECGPVTDPQLRQECFASFQQYEPFRYAGRFNRGGPGTPPTATE
jgi:hypothetical protein